MFARNRSIVSNSQPRWMHSSTERQQKMNLQQIFQEKLEIFFDQVHCNCNIYHGGVRLFDAAVMITILFGLQMDIDGDEKITLDELQRGERQIDIIASHM